MILHTIGIDNGISGALVCLGQMGHVINWLPMPVATSGKRNEVSVEGVCLWLDGHGYTPLNSRVVIEEPIGAKSYNAAVSMASSFHALRGLFQTEGYPFHRVQARTWQKAMLGKCPKETKPMALAKAKELWPDEQWLANRRCKVPHSGAIDAALIAKYWQTVKMI